METQFVSFRNSAHAWLMDLHIPAQAVLNKTNGFPIDQVDLKMAWQKMELVEQIGATIERDTQTAVIPRLRCVTVNDSSDMMMVDLYVDVLMDHKMTDHVMELHKEQIRKMLIEKLNLHKPDQWDYTCDLQLTVRRENLSGLDFHRDHKKFYSRYD